MRCVYTGKEIDTNAIPDPTVMNTEHTWPQSKFNERVPMKTDLHHLFPTLAKVNQVRGNLPFADIADNQTSGWWRSATRERQIPASATIDLYSESTNDVFEPREDHKGNVARAMIYFWVVYGDDNISSNWIKSQLGTLARWHVEDPISDDERNRNQRIKALQGNENPFVLDESLVARVLELPNPAPLSAVSGARLRETIASPSGHRFPDFKLEYRPPPDQYDGAYFRLSQDYPLIEPAIDGEVQKILQIPYDENPDGQSQWKDYLIAVRDYCLAGNVEANWQGQDNKIRPWYHVPWQHYGEKGREGIHGLTREASAKPHQLARTQLTVHQTHAVALYNDRGGYTIGRVWADQFEPNPLNSTFPVGTVVVKILFTQAKDDEVPYLVNPIVWKAYVQDPRDATKRSVQNLRLLQMDIMVRDERANPTGGWVFGTYCYNGALNKKNPWENLVPVGIQWGNDPGVMESIDNPTNPHPVDTAVNDKLKETIINCADDLPPQHLGWGGRLNGPADYFRSSCMSCHSTAQFPVVAPQHPDFSPALDYQPGSKQWMAWFRNLSCGESFNPHEVSNKRAMGTDFSLQLAIGIDNFYLWKSSTMGGYFTPVLPGESPKKRTETFRPSSEPPSPQSSTSAETRGIPTLPPATP